MMRLLLFCAMVVPLAGYAQSSTREQPPQNEASAPSSLAPGNSSSTYAPKASKAKKSRSKRTRHLSPEEDFYLRMQAVAKAHRKQEAEMKKPQYSDPSYFGHKHRPKKHSPKKMKYCKECGIRH